MIGAHDPPPPPFHGSSMFCGRGDKGHEMMDKVEKGGEFGTIVLVASFSSSSSPRGGLR